MYFVRSKKWPKLKEFKRIEVEWKLFESEWYPKAIIYDKKLNKRHPKTSKTNNYNVATSMGTYIELYHHISHTGTTQVRSTSFLHPKS